MPNKSKTENKTVAEKAPKTLSAKRQTEQDHTQGKHDVMKGVVPDCGFCVRRVKHNTVKAEKTKAYFAAHKN